MDDETTDYIGGVHYTDLKVDDIIVSVAGEHFSVYRAKPQEPPKSRLKPGTLGTAVVSGKRIHGLIDEDEDFSYLTYENGYSEKDYTANFKDFEPYEDQ
jgi:hypothetical protein